ncbi:MAG: hypothetical protein Q8M03_06190 [Legionella sp.]|nr:hypothetical protein [Legionella sp.]
MNPFFSFARKFVAPLLLGITYTGLSFCATPEIKATSDKESIVFSIEKIVTRGEDKQVFFKLRNSITNQPLSLTDLKEVHTQKIHLLIIDESLEDYSHIHPTPADKPGLYQFTWHPLKKNASYFAWVDIVPVQTDKQQYLQASLTKGSGKSALINRQQVSTTKMDNLTFTLSFDQTPLKVRVPAMGKITISDAKGKPVQTLEPIMGAFAHIVGFSDDLKTVIHVHPMGKEPTASSDRGGPSLEFHLQADKAGFIKLFAQVKINGKELFVPFGVMINAN